MIILGIDPGYAITGYGVIRQIGNRFQVLDYGVITTDAGVPMPQRLLKINREMEYILNKYNPDAVAIEELFFCNNAKTAIAVGEGRGVAVMTVAKRDIDIYEYTPMQIKQSVVGYGRATKKQVQQMVKTILGLSEIPKPDDAADGLAVAICHGNTQGISGIGSLIANSKMK